MPRARSAMNPQRSFDISGFPEEQKLALDLADTYSSDYGDEPTVKIQVPTFLPKINLADEDEVTEVMPAPFQETKYPGIGLVMALTIGTAIWFLPCYYLVMWLVFQ